MADSASWRREALTRIESLRKGDFRLKVSDVHGIPLPQAEMSVSLYRHDFGFGAAVRLARLLDTRYPAELRQGYQEICSTRFHKLTAENALKWKHFAKNEPYIEPFLNWCKTHYLPVRGHCLVWPGFDRIPAELAAYRDDRGALRDLIAQHVREIAGRFKDPITEWDVLNEPFSEHEFMDILGNDAAIDWFRIAEEVSPDVRRYINDFGVLTRSTDRHRNYYFDYIEWLLDSGAPVQGIGFQAHTPARFDATPPETLLATMDRFATLGLEQQVTEFDYETGDEEIQARYTQDFLIAIFSHPSMTGLINWTPFEYGNNIITKPTAALYDRDLRARTNAIAWNELVNDRWSTTASMETDQNGEVQFRGFKGSYKVEISAGGQSGTYLVPLKSASVVAQVEMT